MTGYGVDAGLREEGDGLKARGRKENGLWAEGGALGNAKMA